MAAVKELVIKDFKRTLERLYGERLDRIILYGSYAGGDNNPESDIDFLVVLKDEKISAVEEISKITYAVYDDILKYDLDISPVPTTLTKFLNSDLLFYKQIRKEGVEV